MRFDDLVCDRTFYLEFLDHIFRQILEGEEHIMRIVVRDHEDSQILVEEVDVRLNHSLR